MTMLKFYKDWIELPGPLPQQSPPICIYRCFLQWKP